MSSPYENLTPPEDTPTAEQSPEPPKSPRAWIWTCIILAAFSILYRLLVLGHKEQTALMFIGVPTLLAIALAQTPAASSATGRIMKGMTMSFLLFGILAIEGFICILVASPLFYLIGAIIGKIIDSKRSKNLYCSVVAVLALTASEGISDFLSFERAESVTVSQELSISSSEALAKLTKGPEFKLNQLPGFLKLGFPQPKSINGSGINVGDQWCIHFAGGEGQPGDLIVEVTESTSEKVTFRCIQDSSHIAHWMSWKEITWKFNQQEEGKTMASMTLTYDRELDPAWYFKPLERYGVELAGEYFMEQVFKHSLNAQ